MALTFRYHPLLTPIQ